MADGSSGHSRGGMFLPRSAGGRWIVLLILIYFVWLTINHPSDAINALEAIGSAFGDLFSAIFQASQGA